MVGTFSGTLDYIRPFISPLVGVLYVSGTPGEGFLLIDRGTVVACLVLTQTSEMKGNAAYERLRSEPALNFVVRKHTAEEFRSAREFCEGQGLLIACDESGKPLQKVASKEWNLDKIQKQPGVLAVSAFHEGFAVQSTGNADFDQVAAVAEDLLRAGVEIAGELAIEPLDQLVLETSQGKFIIAPYGDINICVFTKPDVNLGLIRMAIRNIQSEID
ncbi:MAG: roadblock/LC7 domain-containing protein [Methanomicrobiales archaeon]|nr:roadblock/LC7 domain-containing protein [Methanomicrobiales archaeon]